MKIPTELKKSVPFQYAADVKSGKIVCGQYIKKAVERFYHWIEMADQKGYVLDHGNGMHVIDFFSNFLNHTKGAKGADLEAFVLSPYQQFTLYNIFAWKQKNAAGDYVRVIRTIYEKVARKNGKTAVLSGLGLYCQSFDGEPGPEIYVGATKEAQAKILWNQAFDFVFASPLLRGVGFTNYQREIKWCRKNPETGNTNNGTFKYLGGDSKTLDGLSPNLAIIDEYHSHRDDGVREVLESAMGARKQPLIYIITTAGFNSASVCKMYEDVCKEILDGIKEDDSTFVMIHEPDDGDDWEDHTTWKKANPNLGQSINMDYLIAEHQKAVNQPSKVPNFKTKHLNLWVDAAEVWIPSDVWDRNKVDQLPLEKFRSLGSFAALDLSAVKDLTALVYISEPDEFGDRYINPYFFCPEETIDARSAEDRVPYRYWRDAGYLISTPGNTVDYNYIKRLVLSKQHEMNMIRLEFDQWNSTHMITELMDEGVEVSRFDQGIKSMNFPTKEFEVLTYKGQLKHDGNPVLAWMLSGCVMYEDNNGNYKVGKGRSHKGNKRVDGIVAAIMALGGSLSGLDQTNKSAYSDETEEFYI